jgi:hypothetical protein
MTLDEYVKRAVEMLAPSSMMRAHDIEAVVGSVCRLAHAQGMTDGAKAAHTALIAHFAIEKAKAP